MSKIEDYQKAKRTADRIAADVQKALGEDSSRNDKHRVLVCFVGLENADWQDMKFTIHASHGYYGSSSGYSDTSQDLGGFLARAIQEQSAALLKRAAELAGQAAEKARVDAEEEAKNVLQAIA